MARRVVVGDLRVQRLDRRNGLRSWTIVWPEGTVHEEADRFLRVHDGSGTQKTYAYYLAEHLRWLHRERLAFGDVRLRDLERYMGVAGADVRMPLGEPWREGKRPYGRAALSTAAACLKGFYLHQSSLGVNTELGGVLDRTRLPTRAGRRRALLGHVKTEMPANPLAPTVGCGSANCAGFTWSTCISGRTRPAGSAGGRTCTCAIGRGTRTGPKPRPSIRGGPSRAPLPAVWSSGSVPR